MAAVPVLALKVKVSHPDLPFAVPPAAYRSGATLSSSLVLAADWRDTVVVDRDGSLGEPPPIPLLKVGGSYADAGRAIGEACAHTVRAAVDFESRLPRGRLMSEQLAEASKYRQVTSETLPWIIEELDSVAEGARVDPIALFAASIEEIWESRPSHSHPEPGRCSDIVVGSPLTADGHLWVAHNNDLSPSAESHLVAIEWDILGDPLALTIGIGPWISVGWNAAGLSLTGNELHPNDERVGIPRLLQVRDMMRKRTLKEAVTSALHPRRASSYNNVLIHRQHGVISVEGSATATTLLQLSDDGSLVHTNHYISEQMARYERDAAQAACSAIRYRRLLDLVGGCRRGEITMDHLRRMLADHHNPPNSICRHPTKDGPEVKTVFWCIADVTAGDIYFSRGNPCGSGLQNYSLAAI